MLNNKRKNVASSKGSANYCITSKYNNLQKIFLMRPFLFTNQIAAE